MVNRSKLLAWWFKFKESRSDEWINTRVALTIIAGMYLVNGVIIILMMNDLPCVFCVCANLLASTFYVWTWRK